MNKVMTYTGKLIDIFNLGIEDINIYDIAHALSMKCRFNGSTKKFYSVAQHSVHVSHIAETIAGDLKKETAFAALLHDAAEAYLFDIPSPWKRHISFAQLNELEIIIDSKIKQNFQVGDHDKKAVREADRKLLVTEARDLLKNHRKFPFYGVVPVDQVIDPWQQEQAKFNFLARYNNLKMVTNAMSKV